ncbi:hypothetical protein MMC09_000422 [Bachmanniomyces sp. S44760]|nr:hypothetical protein [Bachmanniomyces sp. S44760]
MNVKRRHEHDLVAVINSQNAYFQLPPEVLVQRYLKVIRQLNERQDAHGGLHHTAETDQSSGRCSILNYCPRITFAAYLDGTTWQLDAGAVIGPLKDMQAMYASALRNAAQIPSITDETAVFKQEFEAQRQAIVRVTSTALFRRWFSSVKLHSDFQITLDYGSELFHFETPSSNDISFLTYDNNNNITTPSSQKTSLPRDILGARPPYPGNHSITDLALNTLRPLNPHLDTLPADFPNRKWTDIPLATTTTITTTTNSNTIPALLLSHQSQTPSHIYPQLWFTPNSRALLRTILLRPQPFLWLANNTNPIINNNPNKPPHYINPPLEKTWDLRGGKSGIWTTNYNWHRWKDICGTQDWEREIFNDEWGVWGDESRAGVVDGGRVWNYWGTQVLGDLFGDGRRESWVANHSAGEKEWG